MNTSRRPFAIVSEPAGYFALVLALGVVSALESPEAARAPVSSLVIRDSDDGARGVLVAERSERGWVLQ